MTSSRKGLLNIRLSDHTLSFVPTTGVSVSETPFTNSSVDMNSSSPKFTFYSMEDTSKPSTTVERMS